MFSNLAPGAIGIQCSWLDGLDIARAAGFEGAEVNLAEATGLAETGGVDAVRAAYRDRGLRIGGWGLPTNWRGSDAEFYADLAQLPEQARLAAEIGCTRVTTWCLPFSDTLSRKHHFDRFVRRFRLVGEILGEHGQRLGLEFIGPRTLRAGRPHPFVYTMDGMLAVCCAIGLPNVGLLFDVWHWYTCGSTLDDVRALTAAEVVYVHLNDAPAGIDALDQVDNRRCLPGETGVIPNRELMRILREIGYDGPLTAEPFNQPLKELAARDPLAAARRTREAIASIL